MHNIWPLLIMASMILAMACGQGGSKNEDTDNSAQETEDATAVTPEPGPAGALGPEGEPGEAGPTGADGAPGDSGGAISLFDMNGQEIGYRFAGDDVTADVFLTNGRRALIDMASGELRAPQFHFLCLHESADCSGACYVYDQRWLNVLVQDAAGGFFVAPRTAVNEGAKTFNSYIHDETGCTVSSFMTQASYRAASDLTTTLAIPAAAPLYWELQR